MWIICGVDTELIKQLPLNATEHESVLQRFDENDLGLEDLFAMQSREELDELKEYLGLPQESLNSLWIKINNLRNNSHMTTDDCSTPVKCGSDHNETNVYCSSSSGAKTMETNHDVENETKYEPNVKITTSEDVIQQGGIARLINQGNTCFLNCAIQVKIH